MTTTPHDKAMKPCPFCGSTDQMVLPATCDRNTPYNENDRAFPIVRCLGCISDISGKDFDASCQSAIDNWNRRAPIEAGNGGDGWNHDMDAAPKDGTSVIVCFDNKGPDPIVCEAYYYSFDDDDKGWFLANEHPKDYTTEQIYPEAWRPLPAPPSTPSHEGREKA